ncbi:MAG: DUF1475 family protein [Alkalibacterium sp.]|nr:DUF1475 family protein [Alkalibacterium sp.]
MKTAKLFAWIGLAAMVFGISNAIINGNFPADGTQLLDNPLGLVSVIDLYIGIVFFSLWITYREQTAWKIGIWIIAMITLGFFAGSVYLLKALYESKDDWKVVLH